MTNAPVAVNTAIKTKNNVMLFSLPVLTLSFCSAGGLTLLFEAGCVCFPAGAVAAFYFL